MKLGYACKTLGVHGLQQRSCTKKTATPEALTDIIAYNLGALKETLAYNRKNGILLFRISSDIIPFGSSPVNTLEWDALFREEFGGLASLTGGMRLSMHPGQYTVLNSPSSQVVASAVLDLEYHARFLDCLGLGREHKLILHIGGAYGDKAAAAARFVEAYRALDSAVKRRLIIENDDRLFHVGDVLDIAEKTGAPVVFDVLHHKVHPPEKDSDSLRTWMGRCADTWAAADGPPKLHYSQQAEGKKPGSHSETIEVLEFLRFYSQVENADVMLEVKDKNLSAIKCLQCLHPSVPGLEAEWSRYKYAVLERSQTIYLAIRSLLKDKTACRPAEFYAYVSEALSGERENALSAAEHVWGYFKKTATDAEKRQFLNTLQAYKNGDKPIESVKKKLWSLAVKYREAYLLHSYYFLF